MTPRRLLTVVGVAAGLSVLGGGGVVLWGLVWPADPDAGVVMVNGRLVAEATGYVARVDPLGRELQVSGSILGFRPLTLVVDDDTTIVIRDKQGTLRDLAVDMPVQVRYELDSGTRRARSVHLRTREGSDARPLPVAETPPAPAAVDGIEPAVKPATAVKAPASAPAVNRPATPAPATPVRREAPPVRPAPTPAPAAMPSAAATSPAGTMSERNNTDQGAADGSAAIDWLINESRRR